MSILDPIKGFGVTFSTMFRPVVTEGYPVRSGTDGASLPDAPPAQPAPRIGCHYDL